MTSINNNNNRLNFIFKNIEENTSNMISIIFTKLILFIKLKY